MEAIRKAGGASKAGLRRLENQDDGESVKVSVEISPKKPAESTDDLMSSLTKALERRRKGRDFLLS